VKYETKATNLHPPSNGIEGSLSENNGHVESSVKQVVCSFKLVGRSGSLADQLVDQSLNDNERDNTMTTENQTKSVRINTQNQTPFAGTVEACRNLVTKFNQLKDRVMHKLAAEVSPGISRHLFERMVGEAEALAWTTPYPLLFLPVLAQEKVLSARQWAERQRQILERQRQGMRSNW
jgi:hypothetical protein